MNPAIELLYSTFAGYRLRDRIKACPCCRGERATYALHTKALRDLTAEDLEMYAFRAMTTIGDLDDFRHFLPRILELVLVAEFKIGNDVILGKLGYAQWAKWPAREVHAIRLYLAELWKVARLSPPEPYPYVPAMIGRWLCAIARVEQDLRPYLSAWEADEATTAQANLARFISDEKTALAGLESPGEGWEDSRVQWEQVREWAEKQMKLAS